MAKPRTKPADSVSNTKSEISNRAASVWPHLALAALVLLTFWPVLLGQFTTWDDNANLAENPDFRPVTWATPVAYWQKPHMHLYVPVTYTLWSAIGGIDQFVHELVFSADPAHKLHPLPFHLANLLLHIATVLVVYALLRRLLAGSAGVPTRNGLAEEMQSVWGHPRSQAAWLGAALFAVHPVQVEAIGWISGLKDLLCALLIWTAVLRYLIFAQSDRRVRWNAAVATIAFLAALLAKPTAMVIPAIALLLQLLAPSRRPLARALPLLASWFTVSAAWLYVTHQVQPPSVATVAPMYRPLIAADALAFYLYKLVFPLWLTNDYGRYPAAALAGPAYWTWSIPLLLAAVIAVVARKHRLLLVAAGMFLLPLAPLLGFVPFDFQQYSTVADHYLYPAMAGVALAAASAIAHARGRAAGIIGGVIIALLGTWSCIQSFVWTDTPTLWNHTLTVNPRSWAAYNTLASLDRVAGRPQDALAKATRSVDLAPVCYANGYATIGLAQIDLGNLTAAETALRRARECDPGNVLIIGNLVFALARQDKLDEATDLCVQAIQIDPAEGAAYINLANILIQQKKYDLAGRYLKEGVRRKPADVGARVLLGQWYMLMGQPAEALAQLRAVLALDPDNTAAKELLQQLQRNPT